MERLQKIIANLGYCSRRKAEELISKGKVKVNGNIIRELGTKVGSSDSIEVEGVILDKARAFEYYLLYKPRGVITSASDDKGRKTVVDLINTKTRIYPVGRLDYDTTGILLLTNDGELTNLLTHPSSNIDKEYIAKVEGIIDGYSVKKLRDGIVIEGVKTSKAKVKLRKINKKNNTCIVELVIHEGKNHQIKKMFEAVGYNVSKLKREKYANLNLEGLKAGEYRKLTFKEVTRLYSLVRNGNK